MQTLYFVLYLLALICFTADALGAKIRGFFLVSLGLAFFSVPFVLQALEKV